MDGGDHRVSGPARFGGGQRLLRKHPDVIGVGEMRSAKEALSAAEASRTGHTVVTTIHSNSAPATYRRMMTLAKIRNAIDDETLMQIMVEAYPIIVFTKQMEDRSRKITEVIEGENFVDGQLKYRTLYRYNVEDNRVRSTIRTSGQSISSNRLEETAWLGITEQKSISEELDVVEVIGHHQKEQNISDILRKRLLDNGISHKELDQFVKEAG